MNSIVIGLIARHLLGFVGAYLAARGVGVADVQTISGALMALGSVAWSYIQKHNSGLLDK